MKCKKRILLLVILLISFLSYSCGKSNQVNIHEEVKQLMEEKKISNCRIVSLCDYKEISKYLKTPKVSDEEFYNYLQEEFEGYSKENAEMTWEDLGYSSNEEFEKVTRKQYIEHLKIMEIFNARDEVLNELIDGSEFELDEKEVADFAKSVVYSYENAELMFGYTELEPYVQEELNMTMDQFFELCLEKSRRTIKNFLVIGAIAEIEGIEITKLDDVNETFMNLENSVYDLFIDADEDF